MQFEVPQWLPPAFVRAVQGAGSKLSREELAAACAAILERWSSSDRVYHGVQHLIDTTAMLETLIPETHEPDLVRLAAWYHGVVFSTETATAYSRNGGEDEAASAEFAYADLLRLGVSEKKAKRVATLVRGMRSTPETRPDESAQLDAIDIDLLALRDAHLGTLSMDPQRYKKYTACVRKEYLHIPVTDFLRARKKIIERLLDRSKLFITPLAQQWEEPTRENLSAESLRIAAKLEAMEREGQVDLHDADPDESASSTATTAVFTPISSDSPITGVLPAQKRGMKDTLSSLESCGERFDPGDREPADLTPEQVKQRKREMLAAEVRKRVEDRQNARMSEAANRSWNASAEERARTSPAREPSPVASPAHPLAPAPQGAVDAASSATPDLAATATTAYSAESAPTPSSAPPATPTPEWIDDEETSFADTSSPTSGMEREPDL